MTTFEEMLKIDVNGYTEEKNGLTYLSWAYAWSEFKKKYPEATYQVCKFPNEKNLPVPYMHDPNTGYMCFTTVTVGGETQEMYLPVMDNRNKAMEKCTMFDVNKTIMRCLVKNLAMFGLGLYIYAGEDLPEGLTGEDVQYAIKPKTVISKSETVKPISKVESATF